MVAAAPAQTAVAPEAAHTGRLGIARIMRDEGMRDSSAWSLTPATIEMTSLPSRRALASATTAGRTWGLTAMIMTSKDIAPIEEALSNTWMPSEAR